MEHLVESHMGGYYISDEDIVVIQRICEQCFDRDNVLISWKKGNKKDQLNKLIEFLNMDVILTYDDIMRFIDIENNDIEEIKDELKSTIEYFTSNKRQMIEDISEEKQINKQVIELLNKHVDDNEKEQLEFVDSFDYSQVLNSKIKIIKYQKNTITN